MSNALEQYVIAAARERMAAGPEFLDAKAQCDEAARRLLAVQPPNITRKEAMSLCDAISLWAIERCREDAAICGNTRVREAARRVMQIVDAKSDYVAEIEAVCREQGMTENLNVVPGRLAVVPRTNADGTVPPKAAA